MDVTCPDCCRPGVGILGTGPTRSIQPHQRPKAQPGDPDCMASGQIFSSTLPGKILEYLENKSITTANELAHQLHKTSEEIWNEVQKLNPLVYMLPHQKGVQVDDQRFTLAANRAKYEHHASR